MSRSQDSAALNTLKRFLFGERREQDLQVLKTLHRVRGKAMETRALRKHPLSPRSLRMEVA